MQNILVDNTNNGYPCQVCSCPVPNDYNFFERIANSFMYSPASMVIHIIDILFFAAILYLVMAFLKKNGASKIIFILVPTLLVVVTVGLEMLGFALTGRILLYFLLFAFFGINMLFPHQARRALWKISAPKDVRSGFSSNYDISDEELIEAIDAIVNASRNMAKRNMGALIIIAPEGLPSHILDSGTPIVGKVSSSLIETIFQNKTPLHDGAICIRGNTILAASCFLPLSHDTAIDKELGTRHRAAIGITESYNVFSIIVSEETGVISVAQNGKLSRYYDSDMLKDILLQVYGLKVGSSQATNKKRGKAK